MERKRASLGTVKCILGDPRADSGGERKTKRAGKYGTKKRKERREEPLGTMGAIHSTKITTGPTGKIGSPQKVDPFFRNFSGWTEISGNFG